MQKLRLKEVKCLSQWLSAGKWRGQNRHSNSRAWVLNLHASEIWLTTVLRIESNTCITSALPVSLCAQTNQMISSWGRRVSKPWHLLLLGTFSCHLLSAGRSLSIQMWLRTQLKLGLLQRAFSLYSRNCRPSLLPDTPQLLVSMPVSPFCLYVP